MSGIYDWSLYIGVSESEYIRCLEQACKQLEIPLFFTDFSHAQKTVALTWSVSRAGIAVRNPGCPGRKGVALGNELAKLLTCNWIWAQDYQRHCWYYYLYRGKEIVDAYHVSRKFCQEEGWNEAFLNSNSPEVHAELLAKACGVEASRIQKYFRDWGYKFDGEEFQFTICGKGKAYPEDHYEYGDGWQLWDFLNKLGFEEPTKTKGYYLNQE